MFEGLQGLPSSSQDFLGLPRTSYDFLGLRRTTGTSQDSWDHWDHWDHDYQGLLARGFPSASEARDFPRRHGFKASSS